MSAKPFSMAFNVGKRLPCKANAIFMARRIHRIINHQTNWAKCHPTIRMQCPTSAKLYAPLSGCPVARMYDARMTTPHLTAIFHKTKSSCLTAVCSLAILSA